MANGPKVFLGNLWHMSCEGVIKVIHVIGVIDVIDGNFYLPLSGDIPKTWRPQHNKAIL